jgi:hypothetical protein
MKKQAEQILDLLDSIRENQDFDKLDRRDQQAIFTAIDQIEYFEANIHESIKDRTKRYQVNNILIKYSRIYDNWECYVRKISDVKYGRLITREFLKQFETLEEAKEWCSETKDFLSKRSTK